MAPYFISTEAMAVAIHTLSLFGVAPKLEELLHFFHF
jgi:hypothetical protein